MDGLAVKKGACVDNLIIEQVIVHTIPICHRCHPQHNTTSKLSHPDPPIERKRGDSLVFRKRRIEIHGLYPDKLQILVDDRCS